MTSSTAPDQAVAAGIAATPGAVSARPLALAVAVAQGVVAVGADYRVDPCQAGPVQTGGRTGEARPPAS